MAFKAGCTSTTIKDILNVISEGEILSYYLGITHIPCVISSPLRKDNRPSFGLYSKNGKKIYYIDFSTGDRGGLFDLLQKLWNCNLIEAIDKIDREIEKIKGSIYANKESKPKINRISSQKETTSLQCKIRDWKKHDIEYWASYGISLKWLKYADVYPISHKIVIKEGKKYVFGADKYAYAYIEYKEGNVSLKIYQPFNKAGYKWSNKHDRSVISLWTKVPKYGDILCICSSLKDALCLWANTGIPAIAVQGEGYTISNTAISELKRRYQKIFIIFDNDEVGLMDGEKLSSLSNFTNIVLPKFKEGKDISDLYYILQDKNRFINIMTNLIKENSISI